jgi:hypothetical protein
MHLSNLRAGYDLRRGGVVVVFARLIPTVVVTALLLASLANGTTSHALQEPPIEDRVNQVTTADQQEPSIAVDPTNPNNVLAAAKDWRAGPKQVWHYRSTDGGRTWADGHIDSFPSELPNQSDPVVTFDSAGTAYMSVLGYNQNDFNIGGLFVARSSDAGATWQKPVLVSANSDQVFNDKEWIAVDRSGNPTTKGNLYATWTLFTKINPRKERGDIVLSRSTDGGVTFSGRTVVSLPAQQNNQGSYPVAGPNGEVYVLYYSGQGAADDGGDGAAIYRPTLQAASGDALYVAKSTDGGLTFPQVRRAASVSPPPNPLPGSSFRMFVLPSLAVDPHSGNLYATWNDYAGGDSDVKLVASTDGGLTWSDPRRVNDDPASPHHDQFFPAAQVGSDGALNLLWLDRRDDPNNKKYVPYYARSTDGGLTFTRNSPVSRTASDPDIGFEGTLIGDYIALDLSPDGGTAYVAWPDTRNGDQDVYFARFSTSTGPAPEPSPAATPRPTPAAMPSPQPLTGFTDEAFLRTWERADRPVTAGKATRPWLWGPVSFAAAQEPYAQGRGGLRAVQYFDKARMEINRPGGDPASRFYVTNGLLVVEMISGRVQTGDQQFEAAPRQPSDSPVAGDAGSPDALTYASLAPVASLNNDNRAQDRATQAVTATLNRAGQVGDDSSLAALAKFARYEPVTGHNIPDVFWSFMNSTGPTYDGKLDAYFNGPILDWLTDLGYPITEPYWTNVKIGGHAKQALVQAFQRRVLTYVADNPPGWQVEMGNVGRHYYDWRYGGS